MRSLVKSRSAIVSKCSGSARISAASSRSSAVPRPRAGGRRDSLGLALLGVASETGEALASLATCLSNFPQVLLNVPVRRSRRSTSIAGVVERKAASSRRCRRGRVLIRYSGTESLARVMIEGADGARIRAMADDLAGLIRTQIGDQ